MYNLYERIMELCSARKITPYRMCKDIGMQPSVITDLKMGRRKTVHAETAGKIAEYFNVSTDYLLGKEKSSATEADDELNEVLEELKNRPEMRMLFSLAKGATKEDIEKAVKIIEALQK